MTHAELREFLARAGEKALWRQLEREKSCQCRPYVLNLLYGRASKLRADRERGELAQAIVASMK